jgi:hypothetical protein
MFLRLSYRAAPVVFLVLSSLWAAGTYFPFFYSLAFPNQEIQHLVGALEGREAARQELTSLVQGIVDSSGHLRRAIRVGAYYGASAEYKLEESHTVKETRFAYLAWFEKRSKPTILIVNLSEIDASVLRFNIRETHLIPLARNLLLPILSLAFSLYWYRRRYTFLHKEQTTFPGASTAD